MGHSIRLLQASKKFLGKLGISACKKTSLEKLLASHENSLRHEIFKVLALLCEDTQALELLRALPHANGQLYQDLFVLHILKYKPSGYFVEFGSTNGLNISNTYLLEKLYNWNGIAAEPARIWHKQLEMNRNCSIDKRCVADTSNLYVGFTETTNPEFSATEELNRSTYSALNQSKPTDSYKVETVSLLDLLLHHNAPRFIDYLSIDTEGSELEILSSFDFSKYQFGVITCEHNFRDEAKEIDNLMMSNKYIKVLHDYSAWDGWYIHPSVAAKQSAAQMENLRRK